MVRGGLLRRSAEHLLIGRRDQTRLVDGLKHQVELVSAALAHAGEGADVRGALCMADVDGLPMLGHPCVDGIAIDGARHVARIARRAGAHSDADVERLATLLGPAFPVA